jgi:hypothetical protein
MKRTRMIEHIKNAIYPHVLDKDPTYIAECILSTIEGGNPDLEGMQPPLVPENTVETFAIVTDPFGWIEKPVENSTVFISKWEPEDEEK